MELIRYWQIIRKRWWLIASLLAIVGVVSLVTAGGPAPVRYAATWRFNVGLAPVPPPNAEYTYNPLEVWQSSEYLMDDLASAVRGAEYARRVQQEWNAEGPNLAGVLSAATEYRVLTISATWDDDQELAQIAQAAIEVLNRDVGELVGPLGEAQPVLRLIDPPVVVPVGPSLRDKLETPIRLGLALLAGVAGAFVLDYVDTSVRAAGEVEELGIAILARIPRHR
jgi:capsular polysaccharide biosynthesis protein